MANYTNIQYKNAIVAVLSYFKIALNEINVLEAVRRLEENGVESDVPDSLGETKAVLLEFENLYHWNTEKVKSIFDWKQYVEYENKNPVDLPKPTKKKDIPVIIKKQNFLVKLILIFVKPFKKIKTK